MIHKRFIEPSNVYVIYVQCISVSLPNKYYVYVALSGFCS